VIAAMRRGPIRPARADVPVLLFGSALFVIHFLVQNWGLVYASATHTAWLVSVSPLAMALLAFVILRERIGVRTILGIVVATVGVVLLVSDGHLTEFSWIKSIGDWLALASAFTWAVYTIATRNLSRRYPPLVLFTFILIPATVIMVGYVGFTSKLSTFLHLPLRPLVALLYLGAVGIAIANWFWLEGVRRIGAARAGVYLYLEPLATTTLAIPYLGEHLGVVAATGAFLALAGVALAARNGAGSPQRNEPITEIG